VYVPNVESGDNSISKNAVPAIGLGEVVRYLTSLLAGVGMYGPNIRTA